jgi:hypothetical protein
VAQGKTIKPYLKNNCSRKGQEAWLKWQVQTPGLAKKKVTFLYHYFPSSYIGITKSYPKE